MRYYALATDYDGTIARHGRVDEITLAALERLLQTGRKLILVTGRQLPELKDIFPELSLFSWVVAENGALLYQPASKEETLLAAPPAPELIALARKRGVAPMQVGRAVLATWHPHESTLLDCIRALGLEYQVIFNKDAVMALPSGVNKATGLMAVLDSLKLSPHEVVGVGDAENDHAFLALCECSVAVDNALPSVKERVDVVTRADHGAGVTELIDEIIKSDLQAWEGRLRRHHLLLGAAGDGAEVRIPAFGSSLLVAGPSGSGKSTLTSGFIEQLFQHGYQLCLIDPEGDYDQMPGAITAGDAQRGPSVGDVLQLLQAAKTNTVVNLVGMPIADRPPFFLSLLSKLVEMRAQIGRPHWLVVDEAHHLMPASWVPGPLVLPGGLKRAVFITVHPGQVSPSVLAAVGSVVAVGREPEKTIDEFCQALGAQEPRLEPVQLDVGEVLLWSRAEAQAPRIIRAVQTRMERRRHVRKYAEGELPPERSFYFRGRDGRLKLRAQNLRLFLQLADGVDDDTWQFHREQADFSRWFQESIKDERLAEESARIEKDLNVSAPEARARIRSLVERYYTLPAAGPLPVPGTVAEPKHTEEKSSPA
ncbi:MAG: HAD family hydrolase [Gemmataceae bacterium]